MGPAGVFVPGNTVISTGATTLIKSGAGVLVSIIVTGGTTGTIDVYDNTTATGTKLASFDTTNAIAAYKFNCAFDTGCTIVTAAATKLSVMWI